MPNGPSGPSSASTALIAAMPSATLTGSAQGFQNSTLKSIDIFEKCKGEDNVMKKIQEMIKAFDSEFRDVDKQFSGLNIFKDSLNADDVELFPVADFSRQKIAIIPEAISQGVGLITSHGIQTVSDFLIASKAVSSMQSIQPPENIWQPSQLIENAHENFFACCKHFMNNINPSKLNEKVEGEFIQDMPSGLKTHALSAISTAQVSFAVSVETPTVVASLLWDTVGSFLRNFQGTILDISTCNIQEEKVLAAIDQSFKSLSNGKPSKESCFETLDNLNHLIDVLTDMEASNKRISHDLVTDAKPFTKVSYLATIPFISSLKLIVNSALGCLLASEAIENKIDSVESKVLSNEASSLDEKKQNPENSHSHSKNIISLTGRFKNMNQALEEAVRANEKLQGSEDASSVLAVGTASILASSALAILPLLVIELGSIVQETAAGIRFSERSSDQIFKQSDIVSQTHDNVGEELDILFLEAIKTKDALEMANELGNTSPFIFGLTRASVCGGGAAALATLAGAHSALREIRTTPETFSKLKANSKLKDEEIRMVDQSIREIKQMHHQASSALSTSAPNHVTGESALESILNKVILAGRISETDMHELKNRPDLNSVGKASVGVENSFVSDLTHTGEFLIGALAATAFVALESSISIEAVFKACGNTLIELMHDLANIQEWSKGPDKTKTGESNSNLSFLSNGLRLLAENKSNDAPSSQSSLFSTVKLLEAISSRSLTVFLMQHGVIADALRNLTRPHEVPDEKSKSRMRTKASAREEVIDALANVIEERLNREDKDVPGLNHDIASQLQSFSRQRIVSALTGEMTLIEPFFVLGELFTAGSRAAPGHDQEALVQSSPSKQASILSNMIQGFILASIDAAAELDHLQENQSLLGTHQQSRNSDKRTFMSTGYVCVSLVESVESIIGRSFTLLDSKKISDHSDEISEHTKAEFLGNLKLSTGQVKADSHLGQPESAICSISALRSTLTHLSAALKECADELAIDVRKTESDDFVKHDLQMHTMQATLMRHMATALSTCADLITRALATGSGLSFSHIILLGKVDQVRELIHSRDESLVPHQNKSSQSSSRDCGSDLSLVTGLSIDIAMSAVTNLTKMLLMASLLGSDVLLSVAKILEILILDINPGERFRHEMQALSVPNIESQGFSELLKQNILSIGVVPTISTGQLSVSKNEECIRSTLQDSFLSLQNRANEMIDGMKVLEDTDVKEDKENKKDLKQYIFQILKTLDSDLGDVECHSLIDRFDKGGIALSSYHEKFGGILNFLEEKEDRILKSVNASNIKNIYNTKSLIEKFIKNMFDKYSDFLNQTDDHLEDPLKKFNQALGTSLTEKAKELHAYVVHGIAEKLYESKHLTRATLWHKPRVSFNIEGFIEKYNFIKTINSPLLQESKEQSEIEASLLQVEEARRQRAARQSKA